MNPLVIAEVAKSVGGITGAATGAIASAATPGAGAEKKDYRQQVARLKNGTLGPTQAEKQGVVSSALSPQRSMAVGQNAELARAIAAGGNIRSAMQATQQQQQALASGAAQAGAGAQQWASGEERARRNEILARIQAKKAENAATWNMIGGGALQGGGSQTASAPLGADDVINKTSK